MTVKNSLLIEIDSEIKIHYEFIEGAFWERKKECRKVHKEIR